MVSAYCTLRVRLTVWLALPPVEELELVTVSV